MFEVVGNFHMHTTYSDGAAPHAVLAAAAIRAGIDVIIVTDHNLLVKGLDGTYKVGDGQVLLLCGQEVHDTLRRPQRNHLLVYGADRELTPVAQGQHPQVLLDAVQEAGGVAFLAHPIDNTVGWVGQRSYSWDDWDISGYTGIEIWNTMSRVKDAIQSPWAGIPALLFPSLSMTGPNSKTLRLWDGLLAQGQVVAAVGSADAHAHRYQFGPLGKIIYRYDFLFRCVNTHLLLDAPLSGDTGVDAQAVYRALAQGHSFVAYSLPGNPRGFRFDATSHGDAAGIMGDSVALSDGLILNVSVPAPARIRVVRHGDVVAEVVGNSFKYAPAQAGAYRVEVWKRYRGRERGWIFANPIYVC